MQQLADLIVRAVLDPAATGTIAAQVAVLRQARTSPYQLPCDHLVTAALDRLLRGFVADDIPDVQMAAWPCTGARWRIVSHQAPIPHRIS